MIANEPLDTLVPLYKNGDDIVTQWQMTDLEAVGLLKVDFLGLKTLTIIDEAERLIRDHAMASRSTSTRSVSTTPRRSSCSRARTRWACSNSNPTVCAS